MGRTTIEIEDVVRDELRSYKADQALTYDEALVQLLRSASHDFRHLRSDRQQEQERGRKP